MEYSCLSWLIKYLPLRPFPTKGKTNSCTFWLQFHHMNMMLGAQKDRFVWPGPTAVRHLCVDICPSQPENHSAAQKHRNLIRKPLSISKKRKGLSVCLQPSAEAGKTSRTTLLNPLELTAAVCTGDWRIEKPTCSRMQHAQINSYSKGNPFIQQAGQYTNSQQGLGASHQAAFPAG